jgi:hypothetical protein
MQPIRLIALVFALAGAGAAFAQQSAPPSGATTCSQQAAYCTSGCNTGGYSGNRMCNADCQISKNSCMESGNYKDPNNGKIYHLRQE